MLVDILRVLDLQTYLWGCLWVFVVSVALNAFLERRRPLASEVNRQAVISIFWPVVPLLAAVGVLAWLLVQALIRPPKG